MINLYNSYDSFTKEENKLLRLGWKMIYGFCSEDDYVEIIDSRVSWLIENEIPYKIIDSHVQHEVVNHSWRIWVDNIENAMAFKLRWL